MIDLNDALRREENIDFSKYIEAVARRLYGEPNPHLSHGDELRFGNNGSLRVTIAGEFAGTWHDFSPPESGGGVLALIRHKLEYENGAALDWLRSEIGVGERKERRERRRIVATYYYHDEQGNSLFRVSKWAPKKTFTQSKSDWKGGWISGKGCMRGVRLVPYRLPELLAHPDRLVFVPEGEKDVDRLRELGLIATCNPGGAEKWRRDFAVFFRGRSVVILPDNDDAGRAHARQVFENLLPVTAEIRVIELPGLPEKGDVSDWLDASGTREELERLVSNAPPLKGEAATGNNNSRSWLSKTIVSVDNELPLGNLANAALGLREDPDLRGVFAYDEMLRATVLRAPVPRHGQQKANHLFEPRPVRDADVAATQEWLQLVGLPTLGKDNTHSAVDLVARENSFHPVREYLDGLIWDGVDRLPSWLHVYLGVEDTDYARAIGTMFLISLVARIYKPGVKVDYMLILAGSQGAKKSTACSILAGEWFSDNMPENLASKDASQHIRGKWLIELAELHALNKSEVTALKSFLTRRVEIYRPSYGRNEVHEPRQCCFIGTTNKAVFLRDETGGRRFWPVTVGEIDLGLLASDRDQLFAEAVHRYRKGEQWWPHAEFERSHILPQQEDRFEEDAWEGQIEHYLHTQKPEKITVIQVAVDALGIVAAKLGTAEQRRITAALERARWVRGARTGGGRWWVPAASASGDAVTR